MSFISIKSICNNITNIIQNDEDLKNIKTRCVVKKLSQYPYMIYIDIADTSDMSRVLTATISPYLYTVSIKTNDIIIITGNITFGKSINFKILSYYIDKPQLSKYEKIIEKLEENNILSIPKKSIPKSINNIAIISSTNAAGLKDCLDIIKDTLINNIYIYPVTLQGPYMEQSVNHAILQCNKMKIDVILLIRGGGSKTDLEWFDNYKIACTIKKSKIPIICGIGHEIDHTIMDIICDYSLNTPTHVASYIVEIVNAKMVTNHIINNIYHKCISKICQNIYDIDEKILSSQKFNESLLEHSLSKIKHQYENNITTLINRCNFIEKAIHKFNNDYYVMIHNNEKLLHDIKSNTNNKQRIINDILNKYSNIRLYDNTEQKYIVCMKDIVKGNKLSIQFIDGEINIMI